MTRRSFLKLLGSSAVVLGTISVNDIFKDDRHILYGDGIHDDTDALNAFLNGKEVLTIDGEVIQKQSFGDIGKVYLPHGTYRTSSAIVIENSFNTEKYGWYRKFEKKKYK